jgi:hypothetical protein
MSSSSTINESYEMVELSSGAHFSFLPGVGTISKIGDSIRLGTEKNAWNLIVGPKSFNARLLAAIAHLGEVGTVRVLDGGNRFNAYMLARAARGQPKVLSRITVSRAFTCYQVLSLLESTPAIQVASTTRAAALIDPNEEPPDNNLRLSLVTPATQFNGTGVSSLMPPQLVVMDLLNTFYDESVQVVERKRLLQACLLQLERLAGKNKQFDPDGNRLSVQLITVHPPAIGSQAAVELLEILKAAPIIEMFYVPEKAPAPQPLKLF